MNCHVLDFVMLRESITTDAALARFLKVTPGTVSRIRADKKAMGALFILRIHEQSGMKVKLIRKLSALPKGSTDYLPRPVEARVA